MATPAQIRANRANARKSTGPRTPEGKARSSRKMFLANPTEDEFIEIFERYCQAENIYCPRTLLHAFIDKHYRVTGKRFRRCHPRDVITHAIDLIRFERLEFELSEDVLDPGFESCFL